LNTRIFYEETDFRVKGWKKIKEVVQKVIAKEGFISGDLNFILTTDNKILELNKRFLERDYFTDVITFEYNEGEIVSGDIFISVDTVKMNSENYKVSYKEEIVRVMIHGILHLCGYKDKSKIEIVKMKKMEEYWLKRWKEL
jgi:rRNA maturation RNase YbeY